MTCFTVHTIPGSPYARAVMAMLEEKQADWRIAPMVPGDNARDPHLSRQPFGKFPVLEWDGKFLYETQAILRYLDELLPGLVFTPAQLEERALMNQCLGICDGYLMPDSARVIVFQRVVGPALFGLQSDEEAIAAVMPRSHIIFAELSRLLAQRPWFGGDQPCIADLMLGPQLEFFRRAPEWIALTAGRANLAAWLNRIEARPSMQTTLWERLPERIIRQTL